MFEGFLGKSWSDAADFTKAAPKLYGLLSDGSSGGDVDDLEQQYELGRSLLSELRTLTRRRSRTLYVTHSPFLINRNAGERIRVLDKA